ncbi:hypothetical protein FQN60_006987 [Etheostoma spectabile]|uniref:Uncharacterized protein n=1 Tax=Etheostoma spectabile TaxID=54343 RepID=A0A5J5CBP0_9PERO|nr:hypothetical protein FQN60_006987 [Etheostoma spectabile]
MVKGKTKTFYRQAGAEPVSPVRGLALGEPSTVWRNVTIPLFQTDSGTCHGWWLTRSSGQVRNALPGHVGARNLPPTRLWRA